MFRKNGRFFVPIRWMFLSAILPQPRWLRRWYYRKSFDWWGHPSNHHWKQWIIGNLIHDIRPGERDFWGGGYCEPMCEEEKADG